MPMPRSLGAAARGNSPYCQDAATCRPVPCCVWHQGAWTWPLLAVAAVGTLWTLVELEQGVPDAVSGAVVTWWVAWWPGDLVGGLVGECQ